MPFPRKPKTYDEASLYDYAIGALGRRMRSVAELKRLLRQRVGHQSDGDKLIESVVARLKEHRYLNDAGYAGTYATLRRDHEKFGQHRVVTELKSRGVHQEVIDKEVGAAYAEVNEEQLARDYVRRKRMQKPKNQKDAARIFRAMARAGFRTRTIIGILKNWDVEEDLLSALEEESGAD